MTIPAPAAGQPVYDTRTNRTGRIQCVPSPFSPFVRVEFDGDAEGHITVVSLEYLAYGAPQSDCVADALAIEGNGVCGCDDCEPRAEAAPDDNYTVDYDPDALTTVRIGSSAEAHSNPLGDHRHSAAAEHGLALPGEPAPDRPAIRRAFAAILANEAAGLALDDLAPEHRIKDASGGNIPGVFQAACSCGWRSDATLEHWANQQADEHLAATRVPAELVADAMLSRIPDRGTVEAVRAQYLDDPFTDDLTYGRLIEEAIAEDDARRDEAEWQTERLMHDRMMGGGA